MEKINWKNTALEKQLAYKRSELKLEQNGTHAKKEYEHILSPMDAQQGANFYCYKNPDEWQALQEWAAKNAGKQINFGNAGLSNMLRSEHIAYNLTFPLLQAQKNAPSELCSFISRIVDVPIDSVKKVRVEYASKRHKRDLLDDNTSFDMYVEALSNGICIGIGIEIKYTEKSYPYGKTERSRMEDPNSEYNRLTRETKLFIKGAELKLRAKPLKQLWRNHLLGIKKVEIKEVSEFYSIHLYPEGNDYQHQVATEYQSYLLPEHKNTFVPLTLEQWVNIGKDTFSQTAWLDYLENRYLT